MNRDIREILEDTKGKIYIRSDGTADVIQDELSKKIDESIILSCILLAGRMPTMEELVNMRRDAILYLLKKNGATDNDIKELDLLADIAVEEKILEHIATNL